jgi:hypothetical protein
MDEHNCIIAAYLKDGNHDDICLVFSKGKFDLNNKYVASLDIDHGSDCNVGAYCSISGWGTTYVRTLLFMGPSSFQLQTFVGLIGSFCKNASK